MIYFLLQLLLLIISPSWSSHLQTIAYYFCPYHLSTSLTSNIIELYRMERKCSFQSYINIIIFLIISHQHISPCTTRALIERRTLSSSYHHQTVFPHKISLPCPRLLFTSMDSRSFKPNTHSQSQHDDAHLYISMNCHIAQYSRQLTLISSRKKRGRGGADKNLS